jgi:hypothetical protein
MESSAERDEKRSNHHVSTEQRGRSRPSPRTEQRGDHRADHGAPGMPPPRSTEQLGTPPPSSMEQAGDAAPAVEHGAARSPPPLLSTEQPGTLSPPSSTEQPGTSPWPPRHRRRASSSAGGCRCHRGAADHRSRGRLQLPQSTE